VCGAAAEAQPKTRSNASTRLRNSTLLIFDEKDEWCVNYNPRMSNCAPFLGIAGAQRIRRLLGVVSYG